MPLTQQQIDALKNANNAVKKEVQDLNTAVTAERNLIDALVADSATPIPPDPPQTGKLPSKGSALGSIQLDNGVIDYIDAAKIPAPMPWTIPITGSMNGVEPLPYNLGGIQVQGYRRMHVYGHGGNYNHAHPIVDGDKITQLQPNLGTDPMLNIMPKLATYPMRAGVRNRHVITPYCMWHGHTHRLLDGSISTNPNTPDWVGITMDGYVVLALSTGEMRFDRKVTVKSYAYDFSYHFPAIEGVFWVTDTGVGELIRVDKINNTQSVWCTGLGRATSCREVEGVVYVTDDLNGKVWAVSSTSPNTKSVFRQIPYAFWVDFYSDNSLFIATRQSYLYDMRGGGSKQLMPPADSGSVFDHDKSFIMCDVDRHGTFGAKDAMVACRSHGGAGNIDLWRYMPDGGLVPRQNDSSLHNGKGVATVGQLYACQDGVGHYPWFSVHHPDYRIMLVAGMANLNPVVIMAQHETDVWVPDDYGHFNSTLIGPMGNGRTLHMYANTSATMNPTIPSGTAQCNATGGGNLWTGDHLAEMPFADGLKFLRDGGIGSHLRPYLAGKNGCDVHLFLCRNSMRYNREGKAYTDALKAFYAGNP